ncbi:hypothetical protein GQF56_20770 [Rhodobacter sphaeroides]|jgi:uncharacterized protein (DUF4415 family)|nr:hypothetical protein [Cereibacter sphaeroides]AMJ49823.1 hypothetical protein APX01_19910 [Cereibacter sphaeroides]ANS36454.1 hypothetical protein A3858_19465 [Cereibacter sphaeroides]ATN65600.1 hypothetical protein A3857_19945 [Cereibacter sphaeroides]AXC64076.1 hypothetical protein DQL45_22080 [Cereibacter sphaeroides 2.4.1]MVX50273.1 hypothetical protein [Cereibacter sphaeroides]
MKRLSVDEVRALKNAGKLHLSPDATEENLPEEFWANAEVVEHESRKSVHLRLDPEVFRFFKEEGDGKGHIKKMQDVLASYVRTMKASGRANP